MALALSIQDLVPVAEGESAPAALARVADLAQLGEALGYRRIWYAEHHSMPNIASSAPEVLTAHVAALTARIRVGAGGVMLPNHVPLRVAEAWRTLAALHPGRIDLGIGRAGGADQRAMRALRSAGGEQFPALMAELMQFDRDGFAPDHPFAGVHAVPQEVVLPPVWILGSSGASAASAGAAGFGYAFASHFSPAPADAALEAYRTAFQPSGMFPRPHAILCVAAMVAPTQEEAERLWTSTALTWLYLHRGQPRKIPSPETAEAFAYTDMDRRVMAERRALTLVGTPEQVRDDILSRAAATGADEVMVATMTHDPAARLASYRLLAEAMGDAMDRGAA